MNKGIFLFLMLVASSAKGQEEVGTRAFFTRQLDPPLVLFDNERAILKINIIGGRVCGFSRALLKIEADVTGIVTKVKVSDVTKTDLKKEQLPATATVISIEMAKDAIKLMRFKPMLLDGKPSEVKTPRATIICEDPSP